MNRHIDADALAYIVASNGDADFINKVTGLMIEAPSIDIVRCQECKHGEYREDFDDYLCDQLGLGVVNNADFFCSDGERREE